MINRFCASGLCSAYMGCFELGEPGDACFRDQECATLHCSTDGITTSAGVCLLAIGAPCAEFMAEPHCDRCIQGPSGSWCQRQTCHEVRGACSAEYACRLNTMGTRTCFERCDYSAGDACSERLGPVRSGGSGGRIDAGRPERSGGRIDPGRTERSGIGFGASVHSKTEKRAADLFKNAEPEDLIKFGLIPELVGRLPVVATLGELTIEAMVQILTEPKNALVKQYQKLFSMDGVDLEIRPSALSAIARKALARKTGARGLRSIMEHALIDTMFDLPTMDGVAKVVIDEHIVEEGAKPLLVYREQKASA